MKELGTMLGTRFETDLAETAKVTVSETRTAGENRNYAAENINDDNKDTYWATNDGTTSATITFEWDEPQTVRYVSMMEYIKLGQRVKGFTIETSEDGTQWTKRGGGIKCTTIGYKRILPLNGSTSNSYGDGYKAKYLRITITASKACPTLHTVNIY
jgi:alpha-L-fucosidase